MSEPSKLKTSVVAAFVGPCLPIAALGLPLTIYLPAYYAGELGLSLPTVGLAFLAVRVLDLVLDPLVGLAIDRTRTRLGRFRPWLIGSAAALSLGTWMLFMAGPGVALAHLWLWLPPAFLGFSVATLTQKAWASALSPDYGERSRLFGWWQAANVAGIGLVLAIPVLLGPWTPASPGAGIRTMGWIVVLLAPVTVTLAVWRVGEPAPQAVAHRPKLSDYLGLLRLGSVRRLMLVDLLLATSAGIGAALSVFFYERVKGLAPAQVNTLLLILTAAAFAGAPLWPLLAARIDKHRALAVKCLLMVLGFVAVLLVPLNTVAEAVLVMVLMGLPYAAGSILLSSMLADCGDEFRLATGVEARGTLYVLLSITTKLGYALGPAALILLPVFGFDARLGHNGPTALLGLEALFVGLPSLLCLVSAALILGHRLDARRYGEIRAALHRQLLDQNHA